MAILFYRLNAINEWFLDRNRGCLEDDSVLVLQRANGSKKQFSKRVEANFYVDDGKTKKYDGVPMREIGLSLRDLLAEQMLAAGEPDEAVVRQLLPPLGTNLPAAEQRNAWTNSVGNVESNDNVGFYRYGYTKGYQPVQYFPGLGRFANRSYEGLVGGWMPAVRKVLSVDATDSEYYEIIVFGDIEVKDPFVVQK